MNITNYYILIPLFSIIINIFFFNYIFLKNDKNNILKAYLLFIINSTLWEISDIILWSSTSDDFILIFAKIITPIYFIFPIVYVNFVYKLISKKREIIFYFILFTSMIASITAIFTDYFYLNKIFNYGYTKCNTPGSLYFLISFFALFAPFIYAISLLMKRYCTISDTLLKKQLFLLISGFFLTITLVFFSNILIPYILDIKSFPQLGGSLPIIQSIFIFILIKKYHFLSVTLNHAANIIFSQINACIIIFDKNHHIIEINEKAKALFEISDIKNKYIKAEDLFQDNYSFKENYIEKEIFIKKHINKTILLSQNSLYESKIFIGKLVILYDISKIKKSQNELRKEMEFNNVVINSSPTFILVTDLNNKIILMNDFMLKSLKYEITDVIGNDINKYIMTGKEKNTPANNFWNFNLKDIPLLNITNIISSDNEIIPVEWHRSNVFNRKKELEFIIFIGIDISFRKKYEKEVIKSTKLESLGVLAGGIAHDFNNILTGILGNISIAKLSTDSNPEVTEILTEAENASKRAKGLTSQLLTFSQGGSPIIKAEKITEVLEETINFIVSGKGIKINYSFTDEIWNSNFDRSQISQVIQNIVFNSIESAGDIKKLDISAENYTAAYKIGNLVSGKKYIKITIKDYGSGISDKIISKVFDPYFSTKTKSSGLGLSICYSIIDKHNGHIYAQADMKSGTKITFYLPTTKEEIKTTKTKDEDRDNFNYNILLMDDEDIILKVGEKMLKLLGNNTTCAANGEEAISLLKEAVENNEKYDIAILDLTIKGGLGGKDTNIILKELDPEIKTIATSGYSNDTVMSNYKEYNFNGILAKPFNIENLEAVLKKVVED